MKFYDVEFTLKLKIPANDREQAKEIAKGIARNTDISEFRMGACQSINQQAKVYDCTKEGHLPIGWTGIVHCEICSQRLFEEKPL